MINFVVVEDNDRYRRKVTDIIITYMMKNKLEFKIEEYADYNEKLSKSIKKQASSNIYILDFELPSATAIDIAREVREDDWESPIIILTAYSALALDSFKQRLQLLDFVGKQIDAEKNINELLDICIKMLNKENTYIYTYFNVEYNIPIKSILYIIREGRQIEIKTDNETYYQNTSISKVKSQLPKDFIPSTKGVLLNMKRVQEINWKEQSVLFDTGERKNLISKAHKKEIEEYLKNK